MDDVGETEPSKGAACRIRQPGTIAYSTHGHGREDEQDEHGRDDDTKRRPVP
jgi:hypothetical protein